MRTFHEFFAGGGMARAGLGSGWKCLFANDFDRKKAEAYRLNWGAAELAVADVRSLPTSAIPGSPDLVWGSFPCQDLLAGGWRRRPEGRPQRHVLAVLRAHDRPHRGWPGPADHRAGERDRDAHVARGQGFRGDRRRVPVGGVPVWRDRRRRGAFRSAVATPSLRDRRARRREGPGVDRRAGAVVLASRRTAAGLHGARRQSQGRVDLVECSGARGADIDLRRPGRGVSDWRRLALAAGDRGAPRDDERGEPPQGAAGQGGGRAGRGRDLQAHARRGWRQGPAGGSSVRRDRRVPAHARRRNPAAS